mmetsp:Transcript_20354/g.49923  ORF Transcript_20354/g.49923 Transcript_20354/m.49923 type:complete len:280 (+) Transcript_20354:99-938(+)
MIDDEWSSDDYNGLEEEEFLNTIWEECTADLVSKSTVDFTSFNSADFTSFNSAQQLMFDRQDSERSLHSAKSNTNKTRLSVHSEEDDVNGASSSSLPMDEVIEVIAATGHHDHHLNPLDEHHDDDEPVRMTADLTHPLNASNDLLNGEPRPIPAVPCDDDSNMLDSSSSEYVFASPQVTSYKSSQTIDLMATHDSPKSPMELMLQMEAMKKPISPSVIDNRCCCSSKRVDFSGAVIIERTSREVKRERIRSKMKAIEDKVVEARLLLNIFHTTTSTPLL